MKRQTMTQPALLDTTECSPLFAGVPVPVADLPAPTRTDTSGPAHTWDWAGRLDTPTWYKPDWTVRGPIENQWKWIMPQADRSHAAFSKFYRASLIHAGFDPFPATYDQAGDCYCCGESGRCPGWHYQEEQTR